jgi:hypothetical protein
MRVTRAMIEAAQRGEFDFHQRGRTLGAERFVPTSPEIVRAMLEAALGEAELAAGVKDRAGAAVTSIQNRTTTATKARPKLTIVTPRKPRSRS